VRIFKTKWFVRYMRRSSVDDGMLCEAVKRAERGLIDADLGGEVIKQRVGRKGQGRSGGYRMLIAFRSETRSVFVYAFAKNEQDNIDDDQLQTLRELAAEWLSMSEKQIENALKGGQIDEVDYDE
jgi:hypothetical protein